MLWRNSAAQHGCPGSGRKQLDPNFFEDAEHLAALGRLIADACASFVDCPHMKRGWRICGAVLASLCRGRASMIMMGDEQQAIILR
jgi:hypothetical protein